jgi:hypothetical protein
VYWWLIVALQLSALIYQSLLEKSKQLQKDTSKWQTCIMPDSSDFVPTDDDQDLGHTFQEQVAFEAKQVQQRHLKNLRVIRVDLPRTFPHLNLFASGGPYHKDLENILACVDLLRPDIGYVWDKLALLLCVSENVVSIDDHLCVSVCVRDRFKECRTLQRVCYCTWKPLMPS